MAVVVIRDPLVNKSFQGVEGFRMYLYTESGKTSLSMPVAPRDITYDGFGKDWVTADRSGNTPLLLLKGGKLKTMSFSALITDKVNLYAPQTATLNAAEALAESTERVLVRYGPQEAGLWRVTGCSYSSELRHPNTSEITRATLSMTLTRASDAAPAVGPVSGGSKGDSATGGGDAPRSYTVVSGDCLWNIAQRFYGNGVLWPRIFDANRDKIKNPDLIYPGQVFTIP